MSAWIENMFEGWIQEPSAKTFEKYKSRGGRRRRGHP